MADPVTIASQFTDFYYGAWQTNRPSLGNLYRLNSTLVWEGDTFSGVDKIKAKLESLPFQKVLFKVSTSDNRLSGGGLLILTTGQLLVDDNTNPLHFSHVFLLMPEGTSFYVLEEIFRLNYG